MAELIADCPRCRAARTTFDVRYSIALGYNVYRRRLGEAYCVCRHCNVGTIFVVSAMKQGDQYDGILAAGLHARNGSVNQVVNVDRFISQLDHMGIKAPDHLPKEIEEAFNEGAACTAIGCFNAAAAMFRLCVDHATWGLLPEEDVEGLNNKIRRSLGFRMDWLFKTGRLNPVLKELSEAIKEDGNDGAHEGTLTKIDAEDILDFTVALLERLYTEPAKLELAKERRAARRTEE